jgi:hypothetical protein
VKKKRQEKNNDKQWTNLVIEALVGTEHHSTTRQTFFHPSFVSLLIGGLDILEAVRAFNNTIGTVGLVVDQILAEDRGLAILTIQNLQFAFLAETAEQ